MYSQIVPITQARKQLGLLFNQVTPSQSIILTKGGQPKVALVDVKYLDKLEAIAKATYQQTYIDPILLPLTREFSNREIAEWAKADQS